EAAGEDAPGEAIDIAVESCDEERGRDVDRIGDDRRQHLGQEDGRRRDGMAAALAIELHALALAYHHGEPPEQREGPEQRREPPAAWKSCEARGQIGHIDEEPRAAALVDGAAQPTGNLVRPAAIVLREVAGLVTDIEFEPGPVVAGQYPGGLVVRQQVMDITDEPIIHGEEASFAGIDTLSGAYHTGHDPGRGEMNQEGEGNAEDQAPGGPIDAPAFAAGAVLPQLHLIGPPPDSALAGVQQEEPDGGPETHERRS